ncbi:helix-turn-helix transcriptional regulator [Anabaena sp. UHCC 0451]|uniref:helix-turn-helix domain-containing protein n=1 Tax=Anabaena sp. UHCC 0451 TaxID=2055235 RepID=UPI002B21B45C|nr:helix-turn-helix transcriptional regulator [Anabaena sp. UHCC 0451]MEA5579177.1 helix-turn-helix transcriptional regulator [Anabaena sp. UHCC 0451]
MKKTNDALKIINKMMKADPELQEIVRESSLNAQVSQIIYDARKQAGLTQQQLADLVGTTQSVIARLEDADYEGHSLSMLARIAAALNQKIEIKMSPMQIL